MNKKENSLSYIIDINKKNRPEHRKRKYRILLKNVKVEKATSKDVEDIYNIASSVGRRKKVAYEGFLMDDYTSNPKKYKNFFEERINELKYFYIARLQNIPLGFLMAYTKEEWLKYNPTWLEDIIWSPDFNIEKTNEFVLTGKIATHYKFTGRGIGSTIYRRFIKDLREDGINNIFSETLVSPTPNFASLSFRKKQKFILAGVRFEESKGKIYTNLVYYKLIK